MNPAVLREIERLRAKGYPMHLATCHARTVAAFRDAEVAGLVRLVVVPDEDYSVSCSEPDWKACYDRESERARVKKAWWSRVEDEGMWTLIAQVWRDNDWQHVDSVGGFLGEDWRDSGYDVDLMGAALDALDGYRDDDAADLSTRATLAGVSP
jgi:hypothetical protein